MLVSFGEDTGGRGSGRIGMDGLKMAAGQAGSSSDLTPVIGIHPLLSHAGNGQVGKAVVTSTNTVLVVLQLRPSPSSSSPLRTSAS